jgi:YVTN family beta-propeller protein
VGNGPSDVACDPSNGEVFSTNYHDNTVSVISDAAPHSVVSTLNVGAGPVAVAYDAPKGEVFVANGGGSTVSIVEPEPVSSEASTNQQSQGQPFAGVNNYLLIVVLAVVLAIVFAGLAIGIGVLKRGRQTSLSSPPPRSI